MTAPDTLVVDEHGDAPVPRIDITAASRAFWLGASRGASVEHYRDLIPPWFRVQFCWRVPGTINAEGKRLIQGGPLSWNADLWRLPTSVLRAVSWQRMQADAEKLAAALELSLARGSHGMAGVQARQLVTAFRSQPGPSDLLRMVSLLDSAEHVLLVDLRADEPVVARQFCTRGLLAMFLNRSGQVLPRSKSVYVVQRTGEGLTADDVARVGGALEVSLHPVLVALDALNHDLATIKDDTLVFLRSAVS